MYVYTHRLTGIIGLLGGDNYNLSDILTVILPPFSFCIYTPTPSLVRDPCFFHFIQITCTLLFLSLLFLPPLTTN